MKISLAQHLRYWAFIAVLVCALQVVAAAEPVPVRYMEGTEHGFLVLRSHLPGLAPENSLIFVATSASSNAAV